MHFSILIYDEPNSAALRDKYRAAHLDYLKAFDDQTSFAGPFTNDDETADLGSLRLIEFPDRAAAEQHVADEPYVIGGVQKRWMIHRWAPHIPQTWRDCPRAEGNMQVMFHALDGAGTAELRKETTPFNLAYLTDHVASVMARGPLLSDDGEHQIGSCFLMDVPDMETAIKLKDDMPFTKAGVFDQIVFHRWRFGRVFDRLQS